MPQNPIQFQKGLSLADFLRDFGSETQCFEKLFSFRWPHGFTCPGCGANKYARIRRGAHGCFQCVCCRTQTSLTSGTILQGTKLPLRQWFLAVYFISQSKNSIAALELKRLLGVCYRTAWRLKHKIMQAMFECEDSRILGGKVAIDDAALSSHGAQDVGLPTPVSPYIASLQLDTGNRPGVAVLTPVGEFSVQSLTEWAGKHLLPGAVLLTDGWSTLTAAGPGEGFFPSLTEAAGGHSLRLGCLQWVHILLSNIHVAIRGTCHAIRHPKYGFRYLAEAQYRFNRRFDLALISLGLCQDALQIGPRTEKWLRGGARHPVPRLGGV